MTETRLHPPTANWCGDDLLAAMLAHRDCCVTRNDSGNYIVRADKVSATLAATHNEYGTTWWLDNVHVVGSLLTASYHIEDAELPVRVRSMHQRALLNAATTVIGLAMDCLTGQGGES